MRFLDTRTTNAVDARYEFSVDSSTPLVRLGKQWETGTSAALTGFQFYLQTGTGAVFSTFTYDLKGYRP